MRLVGVFRVGGLFVLAGLLRVDVVQVEDPITKAQAFSLALQGCQSAEAKDKPDKCKLFGKIEFVTSFGDVKVEVVDAFPDIKVQKVTAFADDPGEWEIVEHFPDFKVEVVEHFGDYKIQYVEHFPGCN
jgi:hypothetical protein